MWYDLAGAKPYLTCFHEDVLSAMTKRFIIILLAALAVMLTACRFDAGEPPSNGSDTVTTGDGINPGDDTNQSGANQGGAVALPGGPLPDAEYTPLKTPERYYDYPVHEFIASADYGQIWPYIGGYVDLSFTWGIQSDLFGICDNDGKIICDPVFNEIGVIENDGRMLYAFIKYDRIMGENYYEELKPVTLAAGDGSWAETFDSALWGERSPLEYSPPLEQYYGISSAYWWRDPVKYDYITALRGGKWGVLGWDGSVLLPFKYFEPVCFYEGLASVLSADGKSYIFIDIKGNIVLGPYDAPPRSITGFDFSGERQFITDKILFYEGHAKFYKDGKFGLIDRSGLVVIPAIYDFVTCLNGGIAMLLTYSGGGDTQPLEEIFRIVNDTGTLIAGPASSRYNQIPRNIDGRALIARYDGSISELVAYDGTRTPYRDPREDYMDFAAERFIIGNGKLVLPWDRYHVELINDELYLVFNDLSNTWRFYNNEGDPVSAEKPGRGMLYSYGWETADYVLINVSKPGVWLTVYPAMVYGLDGELLFDGIYYTVMPVADKFMVRGKTTAGLMRKDGSYVIEVSMATFSTD